MNEKVIKLSVRVILIILISVILWFVAFLTYHYTHEYGHFLAGLINDIPAEKMTLHYEKLFSLIPFPTRIDHPDVEVSRFFRFFGGFVAGTTMLILTFIFLLLHRNRYNSLSIYWIIFAITLGNAIWGYTEAIFESFFLKHHGGAIEQVIGVTLIFILPVYLIVMKSIELLRDDTTKEIVV